MSSGTSPFTSQDFPALQEAVASASPRTLEFPKVNRNVAQNHIQETPILSTNQDSITSPRTSQRVKNQHGFDSNAMDESLEARLERLGRQRPEIFDTLWAEIGFVFSISMSQVLSVILPYSISHNKRTNNAQEYFVSGFTVILPTLVKDLDIPTASSTWPASAFSLTVASFLLTFGRFADMWGGYPVYVGGFIWLTVWSLIAGFSVNQSMLNFCRALQGLGPAAFLPSSMMILGSIYRPGPRKNLVFSIYGACAVLGFFFGLLFAGITAQWDEWGWYFWIGTILSATTALTAYLTIPSDIKEKRNATEKLQMDWLGSVLIVGGLVSFTFAVVDSSHAPQQWRTSYVYIFFIIGCLLLLAAAYVEARVASQPLLPASLFNVPSMSALITALFLTYGSLGVFLLYATFYMENVMGASPLSVVACYLPMALGGCIISTFGGFVLHLLPGTILIIVSGVSWVIAPLLFAIAPEGARYWTYIFPAMIAATAGIDITFNIANIFITTSLPRKQQGLAGAVIMLLLHLGIAVCLGFADMVNTYTVARLGMRESYHAVFWFEVSCAVTALAILVFFVKIKRAESKLTIEEEEELTAISLEGQQNGKEATTGSSSTAESESGGLRLPAPG